MDTTRSGSKKGKGGKITPQWKRRGTLGKKQAGRSWALWAALAICVAGAAVVVTLLTRGSGEETARSEAYLPALVGKKDRAFEVAAGYSVPTLFFDIHSEFDGRRRSLAGYESFGPAAKVFDEGYSLVARARDGGEEARNEAYSYLRDGLPALTLFADELSSDADAPQAESNRLLAQRILLLQKALQSTPGEAGRR